LDVVDEMRGGHGAAVFVARRQAHQLHVPSADRPLPVDAELGAARVLVVGYLVTVDRRAVRGDGVLPPVFRIREVFGLAGEGELAVAGGQRELAVERVLALLVWGRAATFGHRLATS